MSAPSSFPQTTGGTDPDGTYRHPLRRRIASLLLALVAAACLAAAILAGALLWRSAWTLPADTTPTPTRGHPSTLTAQASGTLPTATDDEGPEEGGLTDPELRAQVWSTIVSFYANVRGCADVSSRRIRVSQEPDAVGSWEETWDVSACSEGAALKIRFTVAPDGGVFYDIME